MSQPIFPAPPEVSPNRPSLFELLAQEQLRDLLHPIVRYVLTYFTQRYPRYLLRILNNHEEFFALLLLLVERHHLKRHNASLSEHFYQLRLVPTAHMPMPRLSSIYPVRRGLSRRQRWGMLFFLVGIPYARARAQDYYERLGGTASDGGQDGTTGAVSYPERAFKAVYPYANLALDVGLLGYDIAYLFNKTDHYRPWHTLLGLKIERRGHDDDEPAPSMFSHLPPLIPPLLLMLKLSQWWYSPASPRALATQTGGTSTQVHTAILPPRPLPILPSAEISPLTPPLSPREERLEEQGQQEQQGQSEQHGQATRSGYTVTKEKYGRCPLCAKKWQNPAVLPSGWVVCWRCGWDAVEGEDGDGRCPITGVTVGPGQLRRVLV